MKIRPELIKALLDADTANAPDKRVPYPSAADVLYAGPNPDATRKQCGNCYKWLTQGACVEVAGDVAPTQVCGLHVFGKPQPAQLINDPPPKRLPATVNLTPTPHDAGASCDTCRFYEPLPADPGGLCGALGAVDGLPPVIVEPRGRCARWQVSPGI